MESSLKNHKNAKKLKPPTFDDAFGRREFREKYYFTLDWPEGPRAGTKSNNSFVLQLFRDGHLQSIDYFDFRLYMKVHQHGGLDQKRQISSPGELGAKIEARGFYFTMPGPWELQIRIVVDGVKYAFDIPVNVEDKD